MGITIDTFRHSFQRADAPTVAGALALRAATDSWAVLCVVAGRIDWAPCKPTRYMYGDAAPDVESLCGVTGYLLLACEQQRGMAYHGEAGQELRRHEQWDAAEASFRDFCALAGRLRAANAVRVQHVNSP